jgi:hypothetical protein
MFAIIRFVMLAFAAIIALLVVIDGTLLSNIMRKAE